MWNLKVKTLPLEKNDFLYGHKSKEFSFIFVKAHKAFAVRFDLLSSLMKKNLRKSAIMIHRH